MADVQVQMVTQAPESAPDPVPEPVPVPPVDERARLLAEYGIERDRQIEWRMQARRYAVQMLRSAPVRDARSPCEAGTDEWLRRQGVPGLIRYGLGDEAEARRNASTSHSFPTVDALRVSAPVPGVAEITSNLVSLRKAGEQWREVFIRTLKIKHDGYPYMPQELVTGLIDQLNAPAPAVDLAALAQGAPFPGSTAQALAAPTTACVTLTMQIPLELTGFHLRLSDAELQNMVAESLRSTLQRSIRQKSEVQVASQGISILSTVTRR